MKRFIQVIAIFTLFAHCHGAASRGANCMKTSPALAVPLESTQQGLVVRWDTHPGCIPVTYDPALGLYAADLNAGLARWTGIAGSSLCFGAASPSAQPPALGSRAIYMSAAKDPNQATDLTTVITFDIQTGLVRSGDVFVRQPPQKTVSPAHFLREVGHLIPVGNAAAGVDSIMHGSVAPSDVVTATDEASVLALYGRSPLCVE